MKRFSTCLLGVGLALLLAGKANAQCGFSYTSTMVPGVVTSSDGLAAVEETEAGADSGVDASGIGSDIVLTNFGTTSAPGTHTFNAASSTFTIELTINPDAGGSATVFFTGNFTGTLSPTQANVGQTLTGQSQEVTIETGEGTSETYLIVVDAYTPPGPPGGTPGSFGAHVTCVENMTAIPEPGTMALLGLGVLPMVGALRRRRK